MLASLLRQLWRSLRGARTAQDDDAVRPLLAQAIGLQSQGRHDEAVAACSQALVRHPAHPEALHLLAHLHTTRGQHGLAAAVLEKAAAFGPSAGIWMSLGNAYSALDRVSDALRAFSRAIELTPTFAAAWNNLGNMHRRLRDIDAAEAAYRRALALEPLQPLVVCALADMLREQVRLDEAIEKYREALALDPQCIAARTGLLYALNFSPRHTVAEVYAEHRRWGELYADPLTAAASTAYPASRDAARRLRIGYVSPNFWHHPVSYFFEPTLRHHDPGQFDVICYSDAANEDDYTQRLKRYPAHWVDMRGLDDATFADRVRRDRVDILVDLSGHIDNNRLLMFARKPAAIQVTWNGYANTTGMMAMDYRITDSLADPPGKTEQWHTETLLRLPHVYMAFEPPHPSPPVRALACSANGYVTFGSFNVMHKITSEVLALWARILRAVPDSRLMLCCTPSDGTAARLAAGFAAEGIEGSRLQFVPRLAQEAFLARIGEADIALDPFPFNGTTTTCQTLWMGVPVVTLAGETHVSRVGVSLLTNVGLPDLVAASTEAYVVTAVALARDPQRLGRLRAGLREQMRTSPLVDGARLTRALEGEYRRIWTDYCRRTAL